ncbi:hypothetical protein BB560_004770 [Smittium megazygosporum]|uniref:Peptidase S8/S53 domain-containing protein n=1 Tax=Smittium megazygosporum TaxID=133381 RepID=A0A2T9Z8B3_9FUNG|nr:hypothetical protein BB560_004770 [Smittium megazygosporum]
MLFIRVFSIFSIATLSAATPSFVNQVSRQAPLLSNIDADIVPNSYIIVFKDTVKPNDDSYTSHFEKINNYIAIRGSGDDSNKIDFVYEHVLNGYTGKFDPYLIEYIRSSPEVDYVEQDQVVSINTIQTNAPWGLARLSSRTKLTTANKSKYYYNPNGGTGATAYIIDTGINTAHVDFGGRAVWGANYATSTNNDGNGHGTHVAGTVGGATYGVAKKVKLVAVKVLDDAGSGVMSNVIKGIQYTVTARLQEQQEATAAGRAPPRSVANMSLGAGRSESLNTAVNNAVAAGITYVVSAGNNGANACNNSPASATSAIAVGATDINDNRASFSNYGTCVSIFAPGVSILSTWIRSTTATNTISGTSMASPHICGLAAYFQSLSSTPLTPAQLKSMILNTATSGAVSNPGTGSPNLLGYNNPPPSLTFF